MFKSFDEKDFQIVNQRKDSEKEKGTNSPFALVSKKLGNLLSFGSEDELSQ